MTLQTLVVLVLGAAFGARLAAATVALYLLEGLLGLPVFAGAVAGPAYMAGPTGGFLLGFLIAAALIGFLAERGWDRSWGRLVAAMTLGHVAIFALGFGWLAVLIGPEKAFALGIAPFAAALVGAAWGATGRAPGV
jgi:biotin transport system substrate-specific component